MEEDAPTFEALECVIGKAHTVIPASSVDEIVELTLSAPPPLSRRWVGGLASHQDRAVICVSLVKPSGPERPRTAKGVLLRLADAELAWMLEVARVLSFVSVSPVARPQSPGMPGWLLAAKTTDGRVLGHVDVERMVRELAGTA